MARLPGSEARSTTPSWKARWVGRKAFGDDGEPKIKVIKGPAGPPAEDPFEVDGLSGATLTARGVTNLVHFWLGDEAPRPVSGEPLENKGGRPDG